MLDKTCRSTANKVDFSVNIFAVDTTLQFY